MKLPIIKVRDNCTKKEFIVTDSNSHNYLYADKEGIHYYNLQNGEGTGDYKDSGYSFVGEDGYMGIDIPMVDMADLFSLYYETKIKSLNDPKLTLDLDLVAGHFKALDMRVESKLEEQAKAFRQKMMKCLAEKQIPAQPVNDGAFGKCPDCGYEFNSELLEEYNLKFCLNCGKKIQYS